MINQCLGKWQIKGGCIGGLYAEYARAACAKLPSFPSIRLKWISRSENALADKLSKSHHGTPASNFESSQPTLQERIDCAPVGQIFRNREITVLNIANLVLVPLICRGPAFRQYAQFG